MIIGLLAVAAAATCMGIMPTFQKQVLLDGLPMNSLMVYTNGIISLVSLGMALLKKRSLKATPIQFIQSVLMGTVGMLITAVLLNTAYLYLPVGMAIMLNFLYPSVVCIVMGTVFKQGFTKLQLGAIVCSIAGMIFLAGKGGDVNTLGIVCALVSAFTYGGYLIANEKGPANDLPIETKLFYVSLPGTVLFGILAPPAQPSGWLYVLASGLFTVGGYFLMMYGISLLGASTSAFVSMLEPIVSVAFSTIWFGDPVTVGVAVGGLLVLSSILLIAIDGSKKAKAAGE